MQLLILRFFLFIILDPKEMKPHNYFFRFFSVKYNVSRKAVLSAIIGNNRSFLRIQMLVRFDDFNRDFSTPKQNID